MIKTFPLRFDESFHKELKEAAHNSKKSIHQFIIDAIKKAMKEGK